MLADVLDEIGDGEDHVLSVAVLAERAVDVEAQLHLTGIGNVLRSDEGRHGAPRVLTLSEQPWQAGLLRRVLDVAGRHVEREAVPTDVVHRRHLGDVARLLTDDNAKLDLVVEIHAASVNDGMGLLDVRG